MAVGRIENLIDTITGRRREEPMMTSIELNNPALQQSIQQLGGFGPNLQGFQAPIVAPQEQLFTPLPQNFIPNYTPSIPAALAPLEIAPFTPLPQIDVPAVEIPNFTPAPILSLDPLTGAGTTADIQPFGTIETPLAPSLPTITEVQDAVQEVITEPLNNNVVVDTAREMIKQRRDENALFDRYGGGTERTTPLEFLGLSAVPIPGFAQVVGSIRNLKSDAQKKGFFGYLDQAAEIARNAQTQADVDAVRDNYAAAKGIDVKDVDDAEMASAINAYNTYNQGVLDRQGPVVESEIGNFFKDQNKRIEDSIINNLVDPLIAKFPDKQSSINDVINTYDFSVKKDLEPLSLHVNSIRRIVNETPETIRGRLFGDGLVENINKVYDETFNNRLEVAQWKALGLTTREMNERLKAQGYVNLVDKLWGDTPETVIPNGVRRLITPDDWLSWQSRQADQASMQERIFKEDRTLGQNISDAISLTTAAIEPAFIGGGMLLSLLKMYGADLIGRGSFQAADIGALNQISTGELTGRVRRSASRFIGDLWSASDEVAPVAAGILSSFAATAGRKSASLLLDDIATDSQAAARRFQRLGITVKPETIEGVKVYSKVVSDKIAQNLETDAIIEGAINSLDPERSKQQNKDISAGAILLFDVAAPLIGTAAGDIFRIATRSTDVRGTYLDAYRVIKDTAQKSMQGMGVADVKAIEEVRNTLEAGYNQFNKKFFDAQSKGEGAAEAFNQEAKVMRAKKRAATLNDEMNSFTRGLADRSVLDQVPYAAVNPEIVRYTDSVIQDIRNSNRNVADMIKIDMGIPGRVKFGPYQSSVLGPSDIRSLEASNFTYPQFYDTLLSPTVSDTLSFNPNQLVTPEEIKVIRAKLADMSNPVVRSAGDDLNSIREVFDPEGIPKYFSWTPAGYKLNEVGLEQLQIAKLVPDIAEVGMNTRVMNFYDALDNANTNGTLYPGDTRALRRSGAYERVEEVINKLNPCGTPA